MSNFFAQSLPESIIKSMSIRIKELSGVNLGQGIPSFSTPEHIRDAARVALNEKDIGVYPNFLGDIDLRNAIINKINREYSLQLAPKKNILVTVGAMEAVASSLLSFVTNNERIGIVTPDYCNHFPQAMLTKGEIVEIPMINDHKAWKLDDQLIEKEAKKGLKILILTNPSNPTGSVIDKKQLEKLVTLSNSYGFWILADETYAFLDYSKSFASLLDVWDQGERILVVRSFSKEYAMTGWRVGYVIAKDGIVPELAKTHDALVGCVPKISQRAATVAITGSQSVVTEFVTVLKRRQELACSLLDDCRDFMTYVKPQGAYYIFPKYSFDIPSLDLSEQILTKAKVAVVPGAMFGNIGEGHIRISFAVEDEILRDGIAKINTFFKTLV